MHADKKGVVFIPPLAVKNCVSEAAKFKGEKIQGEGQHTWTKHFNSGILCVDPISLGIDRETVEGERLFLNADGKRGGGTRVWKTYPVIREWRGQCSLYLVDDKLIQKPDKVLEYLEFAGKMIGIGRFRPANRGYYGRFKIENFKTQSEAADDAA
ncbi:MAG: hypothetical protein GWP08_13930 [Nitrospiraceae bacterium]|nr:hypothetical protein [Nitrospiraceae bacterium]